MAVAAIHLSLLLISVVPIFVDAATDISRDPYHGLGIDIFTGFHTLFVNPVVDILGFTALYAQARIIRAQAPTSGLGALSLVGLAVQAVVFALFAPAWLGRLVFPWAEFGGGMVNSAAVMSWFELVGFVPFDNAVCAVAQFVLLLILLLRQSRCWGVERALKRALTLEMNLIPRP
jgi:hypothetical protein